jgi:hypothetical protein
MEQFMFAHYDGTLHDEEHVYVHVVTWTWPRIWAWIWKWPWTWQYSFFNAGIQDLLVSGQPGLGMINMGTSPGVFCSGSRGLDAGIPMLMLGYDNNLFEGNKNVRDHRK